MLLKVGMKRRYREGSHFSALREIKGGKVEKIFQTRPELAVGRTASSTENLRSMLLNEVPDARLGGLVPA